MKFYLGSDAPNWLWHPRLAHIPLCISHNRLRTRISPFPPATTAYVVDSGAFTHLNTHGRWTETPEQYVTALRRYWRELGPFDWAAQQDSLCAPPILDRIMEVTGHRPTIHEQQQATVVNYLRLRDLAPDLPIVPVLQGTTYAEWLRCADMFETAGVDLVALPTVGLGSIVGADPGVVERVATGLHHRGIRLHGFGLKTQQVATASRLFQSADSQSWSFEGRRRPLATCTHRAKSCAHCVDYAVGFWLEQADHHGRPQQISFPF